MPLSESLSTGGTHADQRRSPQIGNRRGATSREIDAVVYRHRGACTADRREIERLATMAPALSEPPTAVAPASGKHVGSAVDGNDRRQQHADFG